jgi:DNA gyrase/topoisomerase IV subunit A
LENDGEAVNYSDFINKELILFSLADCERSIPNLVDGLKPTQRKILYSCFKSKSKKELKVSQMAGDVAKTTAYHHGEASLQSTIVAMAQNFVGSNNINLLYPSGQFGSRLQVIRYNSIQYFEMDSLCREAKMLQAQDIFLQDSQTLLGAYFIQTMTNFSNI